MKDITINWKFILIIGLMAVAYFVFSFADRIPFPPFMMHFGLIVLGVFIVVMGIGDIRNRTSSFYDEDSNTSATYHGFSAIMWGVWAILIGVCLTVVGVVFLLGAEETAVSFIKARPGIAFIIIGLFMLTYGIPTVIGSVEERQSFWSFLGSMPGRLFSIILIFIGLGIILIGAWEIVAPSAYDELIHQFTSIWTIPE